MSDLIGSDDPFSAAQKDALREIVGYMIPAGSGRPAASDEPIFADILNSLRGDADVAHMVLEIYANTDLEGLSRLRNPAVSALVAVTVQCYYRDDAVMQALEMEARPPHPQGYAVDAGDYTLLDPVRERGAIYRKV